MTSVTTRFTLIVILAFLSACSSLPPEMPSDFSVTVLTSGGMLPVSSEVTYSSGGCRYHKRSLEQGQTVETDFRFTLSPSELRSLYRVLVEQKFDAITAHHEEIYDRGGFQVTVTANGRSYTVVDGGQTVVDAFWLASWRRVYEELQRLEDAALKVSQSWPHSRSSP